MSIAKQKAEKDKKELAAIKKQKCAEAHLALVRLLVPPTTHQDLLRVMPEQELFALTHSQLAAQAARLMTNEDPQGKIACGGIAIDQFIIVLSAVTVRTQQRQIDKILHDKKGELDAIDAVNEFMDLTEERKNPDDDGGNDGNNDDTDSLPGSSDSGSDSEEDDVQFLTKSDVYRHTTTSSSSRPPAGLSTLGIETTVGKEVIRDFGKRKSNNTPMLAEFHGQVHHPVLTNIANPALKPSKSKKSRRSAAEDSQQMQFPSDLNPGEPASMDVPLAVASWHPSCMAVQ